MQVGSLGQKDPLEEDMPTNSIILVQRIPWTEEPGGLQPIQWQSQTRLKQLNTHANTLKLIVYNLQISPFCCKSLPCNEVVNVSIKSISDYSNTSGKDTQ